MALHAVILKLLPDLDEGHLVVGVSEPLVHLGELHVEAEVVNVLGVARHRHPLALQPNCIGGVLAVTSPPSPPGSGALDLGE